MSLEQVYAKLEKIRAFDSLIDFSKSRIQLDIVLHLASAYKPLSADELAKALNVRKKPVLDALRKLEIKGIVRRVNENENIYELSDLGKQMIEDLMAILGFNDFKEVVKRSRRYGKVEARDLIKLIIPVHYLYEVLVALGTAKNHELPAQTLAMISGITPQRLAVYLDPYADNKSEVRLFKKIKKETLWTRIKNFLSRSKKSDTFYKLTSLGLETFYRLPIYPKVKNNRFAHYIIQVFGCYSPKLVLSRFVTLNLFLLSGAIATIIAGVPPLIAAVPVLGIGLVLTILIFLAYE